MSKVTVRVLRQFPSKLPITQLPTNGDVIKAIYFEKESQKISREDAIYDVVRQIHRLWQITLIPIISKKGINKKLSMYFSNYTKLNIGDSSRAKNDEKKIVFKVRFFIKCLSM